jgi:LPPG:FO 2-phospho-L-lactate transferase
MLVVLTGGTGGAKLIHGLSLETRPEELFIVCNTADDFILHGLYISPDIDTITYTLAGIGDTIKGWGIQGDTFTALEQLARYGGEAWFKLGDKDFATHIKRTKFMAGGLKLSQATEKIRRALGVKAVICPMTDQQVETRIETPHGELSFQEYFVRERWRPEVKKVVFAGVERCRPAPGVIDAVRQASAVIVCPSNPVTSIGPILAVPGLRVALRESSARVIAISPIIGDAPVSGPAHKLMAAMGMTVSAFGVAEAYADFAKRFILDSADRNLEKKIAQLGVTPVTTPIHMNSFARKRRLAREVLALIEK